jgi:PleD family two-component response regulator
MHPPDAEAGPRAQVLVIAGDPHILSQVRRILDKNGLETLTATSGQAGLNLFQQEPPDLVLLDLQLPDANGLDLIQKIKDERRYIPVMVMASASETSVVAALRQGADDYLSKPIVPEELLERVRHNLERGRQARVQAELTGQLQRQLAMLISVREVAREASTTADLYALLQRALEQTLRNMHFDAGIVFVSENGDLIPLVHRGLPQAIASALTRQRLSWSEASLLTLRRARKATRIRIDEQRGGPLSQAVGYKFTAIVPLWAQERCWGMLEVASQEEPVDPAQDLEVLTTVGQQVAISLANARLHEAAALRVRELALLNEACLALTSDLDLEQILTTIMLRTSDVIGVETGSLLLSDEMSGELIFRISLGGDADQVLSRRIPLDQGIAGWVFRNGQPLLVPDVRQDVRYYPEIDQYARFHTRSILCVPLRVRGESFGVIELVNRTSGEFTDEDLHLLESVAALTATAIEQSRLHEWTTSFILVDPQTHLPNHRLLTEALERESARCRRYGRTCSLLILGVDRRLPLPEPRWRELTAVLKKALRQSDLLCRHRDGPFVAILPETSREGARILAGRLLEEIRQAGLSEPAGVELAEHMRCGLAAFPGDVEDPKDLLEQAEMALAEAWQEQPDN